MMHRMKKKVALAVAVGLGTVSAVGLAAFASTTKAWLAAYNAQSAEQKLGTLWGQTLASVYPAGALPSDGANPLELLAGLTPMFLKVSFLHNSDFMPEGRRKVIHTFGVTAQSEIQINPGSNYSGILSSGAIGLTRLSLAVMGGSFTPGIAVKALIDGEPSVNFIAMYSLNGQGDDRNFFSNAFCTKIPEPRGIVLKLGALAFRNALRFVPNAPVNEGTLPLNEAASIRSDGTKEAYPITPSELCFEPKEEIRALYRTAYDHKDFREVLARIPADSAMYSIRVRKAGETDWDTIGQLVFKTAPVASKFADENLFFVHQRRVFR